MRISSLFSSVGAITLVASCLVACSGLVQVTATPCPDGGTGCAAGDGGGGDANGGDGGGNRKENESCSSSSDCVSGLTCMFPLPNPGAATCGTQGLCQMVPGCGVDCALPITYLGCDCAGHSVNACMCDFNGFTLDQFSVVYASPIETQSCPNDPPSVVDAGPGFDSGPGFDAGSDGNDLNKTGSLTVDGFKCSLTASTRNTESAPDGHTWDLDLEADCPVQALGHVSVYAMGKDNIVYPYGCDTSAGMQLSVSGEGDAGFLAYSGGLAGGSCEANDGPTTTDEANKIRGTGTLSNGAGKTHTVDIFEP